MDPFKRLTEADRLQIRKDKNARKIERWSSQAISAASKAEQYDTSAHNLVKDYPMGQPYHVEKASGRAMLKNVHRSQDLTFKSIDAQKKAEENARKADTLSYHNEKLMTPADLRGRILKLEKELKTNENKIKKTTLILKEGESRNNSEKISYAKTNIRAYKRNIELIKEDIESLKKLLPKEEHKPIQGLKITDIPGGKLKKALGLKSATKRYYNKNLKGGNFAIDIDAMNSKTRAGYELTGVHDTDGVIRGLMIGLRYGTGGVHFKKEDLNNFENAVVLIKKVIDATEKK